MKTLERLLLTALHDLAALQQSDPILRRLTRPVRLTVHRGLKEAQTSTASDSLAILVRTAHVAAVMLRSIHGRNLETIAAQFDIAPAVWRARVGP